MGAYTEAINLIYVAITRARRTLRLSSDVWSYVQALTRATRSPGGMSSSSPLGNANDSCISKEQLRKWRSDYEEAWQSFTLEKANRMSWTRPCAASVTSLLDRAARGQQESTVCRPWPR